MVRVLRSAAVLAAALLSTASAAETTIAAASGVELTLTQLSGSSAGLALRAQLFPKIDVTTGAIVDFDARVTYDFHGEAISATIVNRKAYASVGVGADVTASCLTASQVPAVTELVDAFLHPTVLETTPLLKCAAGSQPVVFTFSDETYGFCAKTESLSSATIGDASATFALLESNSQASPLTSSLAIPQGLTCTDVYGEVSLVAKAERKLKAQADCTCKDGKKACLFIHGLGLTADGPALDEYTKCWGDIKTQAQCCSSMKFMQMDTTNNAWYGDYLSKKVCDTAIAMAPAGSNKLALEGMAFIGHSMGNLVIANAELKGFCALGSTSKWISLAGPLLGSQSANFGIGACASGNALVKGALSAVGICPIGATIASMPYIYTNRSSSEINSLYEKAGAIYRKRVTSNLCGVSPTGLTSTRSVQYGLLGSVSGHATKENDGAVHILSCQAGLDASKYSTTWSGGNFYKADINHGDSSFVTGDGSFGDSRKPIKWFNCQF